VNTFLLYIIEKDTIYSIVR